MGLCLRMVFSIFGHGKLNLGGNFIDAISAIYHYQEATLRINNDITNSFKILKGIRQGCPLSPLIYIGFKISIDQGQRRKLNYWS